MASFRRKTAGSPTRPDEEPPSCHRRVENAIVRGLLIAAGLLLAAGLLWPVLSRYAGRLPGDLVVRRPGFTLIFPIVTCIVVSLLLTLVLWLFRR
jgi:DUF2905 family protein